MERSLSTDILDEVTRIENKYFVFTVNDISFLYLSTSLFWLRWVFIVHSGSPAVVCGLTCPVACGISVPQPGIKPTCPVLGGGFLISGPPGKVLFL